MVKWILGGAVLGAGVLAMDYLYDNYIEDKLPLEWQRSLNDSSKLDKSDFLYYAIVGAGAVALLPVAAKIVGQSALNPIKPELAPVKA